MLLLVAEDGLGRGQSRDRHAVGRTRHVIETDLMAELDRARQTEQGSALRGSCPRLVYVTP